MTVERTAPPGWASLAWLRVVLELRLFVRDRQLVTFSFLYPIVMLLIFGSVFDGDTVAGHITYVQYFLAGIIGTGVMLASFQNLGISVPVERDSGELARLQVTALPAVSYFVGKAGQVLALTVVQVVALLLLARYAYGISSPAGVTGWLTLGWAVVLGTVAGTTLGVAVAALPANARSAGAVVAPIALVLQFFSGVFFVYAKLPSWMQQAAAVFPLKWLTQAMRSALLPGRARVAEVSGGWQRGECALVLAGWALAGLLIAWRTFSWRPRE